MYTIRISQTPKAIRTNQYNVYKNSFNDGYPVVSVYYLPKQNSSLVFKQGGTFVAKSFKTYLEN